MIIPLEDKTLTKLIKRFEIGIDKIITISKNPYPYMNDPKWEANHYEVTMIIRSVDSGRYGKKYTTYFSQGLGIKGKPKVEDVLNCLVSDMQGVSDYSFEDWCGNYGYDTDSRNAEKTYKTIVEQSKELEEWLGSDLFRAFKECEFDY